MNRAQFNVVSMKLIALHCANGVYALKQKRHINRYIGTETFKVAIKRLQLLLYNLTVK